VIQYKGFVMYKFDDIISRIAGDTVLEYTNIPMQGVLKMPVDDDGYVVLTVPEGFVTSVFQAIHQPNMERGSNKAHISVFTDEELKQIGIIKEAGQTFEYTLGSVQSCDPDNWDEMEKVFFIECKSSQLEALRKSYDLPAKMFGKHEFHITVAVIPKKT